MYTGNRFQEKKMCHNSKTLTQFRKLPPNSNKAKLIMEKVTEFIILDNQRFCLDENVGFQHLIKHLEPFCTLPNWHFICKTTIPNKNKQVCEFISNA